MAEISKEHQMASDDWAEKRARELCEQLVSPDMPSESEIGHALTALREAEERGDLVIIEGIATDNWRAGYKAGVQSILARLTEPDEAMIAAIVKWTHFPLHVCAAIASVLSTERQEGE